MAKQYRRTEVLERLKKVLDQKNPIIAGSAGAGIVAKCTEIGGIELIIIYSTGRSRIMGLPTATIGNPNTITLDLAAEILFVVKETPVIGGICTRDVTRDMSDLLNKYKEIGFSGVINFPSVGSWGPTWIGDYFKGLEKEAETMCLARDMDFLTMSYAYRVEEVPIFAPVVDVLVAHAGWTAGGTVGAKSKESEIGAEIAGISLSLPEAAGKVNRITNEAKKINPQLIMLCHGGPVKAPKETEYIYKQCPDIQGFVGGSSIERIPIEQALIAVVKEFKSKGIQGK